MKMNIVAGDFNSSVHREGGRQGVSSIDEAWSEAFLVPPPSKVPMWRQVQESEDCCDFTLTKKSQCSSRVASYGSF